MRFIHTGDWHLFDKHKYSIDGSRLKRLKKNIMNMVNYAIKNDVDYIFVAGDVFHNSNPDERMLSFLVEVLSLGVRNGIKWRIVIGNHDTDGQNYSIKSMDKLSKMITSIEESLLIYSYDNRENISVYSEMIPINDVDDLQVLYVPWQPKMVETLAQAKEQRKLTNNVSNILVTHTGVIGAYVPTGWEADFEAEESVLSGYDYVALGDFHTMQKVGSQRFRKANNVWYSGSLIRITWAEKDDDKGFLLVDIDGRKTTIKQVKVIDSAFIEMSINYSEIAETFEEGDEYEDIGGKLLNDSYIKLRIHGDIGLGVDVAKLETILYNSGAKIVYTKLIGDSEESLVDETGDIDLSLDCVDAVTAWAKKNKLDKEMLEYGLNIIDEVKNV